MRLQLATFVVLAACTQEPSHLGNPLMLPASGIATMLGNAAYDTRRGAVEILVKSRHAALLDDIRRGDGPTLTQAMDTAGIPPRDRPARILQLQGDIALYQTSPGALVTALMVYGT